MNYILNFGGPSKEAVIKAFRAVVGDTAAKILVLPAEAEEGLDYRECDGTLDAALVSLGEGHSSSVHVHGQGGASLLAGIYRSRFANERLADWTADVEGDSVDTECAFNELQAVEGVTFVSLSQDDSPKFADAEHVTEANFPWSDWRLVVGAVRSHAGPWVIRRGNNRQGST